MPFMVCLWFISITWFDIYAAKNIIASDLLCCHMFAVRMDVYSSPLSYMTPVQWNWLKICWFCVCFYLFLFTKYTEYIFWDRGCDVILLVTSQSIPLFVPAIYCWVNVLFQIDALVSVGDIVFSTLESISLPPQHSGTHVLRHRTYSEKQYTSLRQVQISNEFSRLFKTQALYLQGNLRLKTHLTQLRC